MLYRQKEKLGLQHPSKTKINDMEFRCKNPVKLFIHVLLVIWIYGPYAVRLR